MAFTPSASIISSFGKFEGGKEPLVHGFFPPSNFPKEGTMLVMKRVFIVNFEHAIADGSHSQGRKRPCHTLTEKLSFLLNLPLISHSRGVFRTQSNICAIELFYKNR